LSTISDVARLAEVSIATVSRFQRGEKVRAAERIRAAIDELEYRPNHTARSLRSGIKHAVAVVVPDVTNPFFAAVVKGVESVSRESPYNIFLYNTDESAQAEDAVLADLVWEVDGIILAPSTEQVQTPVHAQRAGVPLVFIDRTLAQGEHFDSVLVDNYGGGRQAAEHLLELGHRRLAIIAGPLNTTPGRERFKGFVDTVQAAGIEMVEECRQVADFRESGGYQAALALLGLAQPPTAIFSSNNLMTIGALKALTDMGARVPEDFSLIGFDDLKLAPLLRPALTVIERSEVQQGVLAMRLLLRRLAGNVDPARTITLETRLVKRASCAPLRPPEAVWRASRKKGQQR
jgi:LacI family transcriptional regulator